MNDRIQLHHLDGLAIIYIRQSSGKQVRDNQESRRRQRALVNRAKLLGWSDEKIVVLEEEKGRSGSSTIERTTYRRAAELVCNGQVGIILAVEVSRWSRDSAAWQLLLRDCAYGCVLLGDEYTVYDPANPHDHVSLGIQGVLAEYELRLIRQRSLECYWEKARRGEIFPAIGTGYVMIPGKGLEKHPNVRVQNSVQRMFQDFKQMPSVLKLCQWYLKDDIRLPHIEHGDDPQNVQWLPANYKRMLRMLKNPVYTGAYVIGRSETVLIRTDEGELVRRRREVPPDKWKVVEMNRHAAYISWEQYERNVAEIKANSFMHSDASQEPPRRGKSILSGLLRCAHCMHKLHVVVQSSGQRRYVCKGGRRQRERGKPCQSFSGRFVDPLVTETLLEVLRPAGIEAARRAAEMCCEDYQRRRQSLLDQVKQLEYEAERAGRQYDRVEPENRLVAAGLESRWNEALVALEEGRRQMERFDRASVSRPSDEQVQQLVSLGKHLERVWYAEQTDVAIQKEIADRLVHEIIVAVDIPSNEVILWIHWTGGHHTQLIAPRGRAPGRSATVEAKVAIRTLRAVCDDTGIAHALNRNGIPCGSDRWTTTSVRTFRERHGIEPFDIQEKRAQRLLTQQEAGQQLGISPMSVHRLVQSKVLPAKQPGPGLPCVIYQADLALSEVVQAVDQIRSNLPRPLPDDPNQLKLF